MFSHLGSLEQQCDSRNYHLAIARQVGKQPPAKFKRQLALSFFLMTTSIAEALPGIGGLMSDIEEGPAVADVALCDLQTRAFLSSY